MKLLIADDEELTRKGLISSINWKSLGIDQIFEADDGIHAFKIASVEKPDIILSDIRMPRMSGIEMAERLEAILPDTSLIFMSGYSDKEYLKAAIKLKAVNYVEKPLDPEEVRETVTEAISLRNKKLRSRQNEVLYSQEASSHLAFLLTRPYRDNEEEICVLSEDLALRLKSGCTFTSYVIKTKMSEIDGFQLKQLLEDFSDLLRRYHLKVLYARMHTVHHVFFLIGESVPSSTALSTAENYIREAFSSFGDFFIGRGETQSGIARAYDSYASAVITLQCCFFFAPGQILIPENSESVPRKQELSSEDISEFSDALLAKDEAACTALLEEFYNIYFENRYLLPNQVKDVYYKLFMLINDTRRKLKLPLMYENRIAEESIITYVENCFSYQELHQNLVNRTADFFQALGTYVPEDSTIFLIKNYISKNYGKESLSIKEISDHVFLSASYVCTYFKSQTGQTLNQYITEYRMERAMSLLADERYQIADISAKVGYSNGNYFSKSFKKFTGLSPSKYREKALK